MGRSRPSPAQVCCRDPAGSTIAFSGSSPGYLVCSLPFPGAPQRSQATVTPPKGLQCRKKHRHSLGTRHLGVALSASCTTSSSSLPSLCPFLQMGTAPTRPPLPVSQKHGLQGLAAPRWADCGCASPVCAGSRSSGVAVHRPGGGRRGWSASKGEGAPR